MVRTFYSKLNKFRFLPYTALAKEYGETNNYSIWGIEGKNSHKINGDHTLTYGTEYDRYSVDGVNFGTSGTDGKDVSTYAAYVQDEWLIGDKWVIIRCPLRPPQPVRQQDDAPHRRDIFPQ